MITSARFHLKQMWRLTKAWPKRSVNTEQRDEIGAAVRSWL